MSQISVMGLGSMGSALAYTILQAGHQLTVWNRTPGKMAAFVDAGAVGTADAASAVRASPVIVVSVSDYEVTRLFLESTDVALMLSGKTVVQLSTGTPQEALGAAGRFSKLGASYLDGAILGGPEGIGDDDALILYAGERAAFDRVEPLVACLAGNTRYVGDNIRAAAALDLAWLCQRYGLFLGLAHGAYLCESEDVSVDLYATMFPDDDRSRHFAEVIGTDAFEDPSATLRTWEGALRRIQQQAVDAGINGEIPAFASGYLKSAIAAGHGEQDVAAIVKVLRSSRNSGGPSGRK